MRVGERVGEGGLRVIVMMRGWTNTNKTADSVSVF